MNDLDLSDWLERPACFGHLRYAQADPADLVQYSERVRLHIRAAEAFLVMSHAMSRAGCPVVIHTGFRSLAQQQRLFDRFAEGRGLGFDQAIHRVAPPGFSEHHTGYAIDIELPDSLRRAQPDLKLSRSPAYAWLRAHGHRYGFRNSFFRNNPFGIRFEPWHWAYCGDAASREVFRRRDRWLAWADRMPRDLVMLLRSPNPLEQDGYTLDQEAQQILESILEHPEAP